MKGFAIVVFSAVFFTFLACDYLDTPVVYQSYSTRAVKGWEDRSGYHSCVPEHKRHAPGYRNFKSYLSQAQKAGRAVRRPQT